MEKKRFLEGDNKRFCVVSRLLCFFCLFIGIYACQVDEDGVVNKGTLAFRMNVDTALVGVSTKASDLADFKDVNSYAVTIAQDSGVVAEYSRFDKMPAELELGAGAYTIQVSKGTETAAAFDAPYFSGKKEFTIVKDMTTPVEVTAAMANSRVTIDYSDDFLQTYKDYTLSLKTNKMELPLVYEKGESRPMYFLSDASGTKLEIAMELVNIYGKTVNYMATTTIKPKQWAKLTVRTDEKGLNGIAIDVTLNDETKETIYVNIGIPDFMEKLKGAPYIACDLFKWEDTNVSMEEPTEYAKDTKAAKVVITSGGKINQVLLTIKDGSSTLINQYDLANLTEDQIKDLADNYGFSAPEKMKGEMQAEFDLKSVIASLLGKSEDSYYELSLTVVDALPTPNRTSKSVRITVPAAAKPKVSWGMFPNNKTFEQGTLEIKLIAPLSDVPVDIEALAGIKDVAISIVGIGVEEQDVFTLDIPGIAIAESSASRVKMKYSVDDWFNKLSCGDNGTAKTYMVKYKITDKLDRVVEDSRSFTVTPPVFEWAMAENAGDIFAKYAYLRVKAKDADKVTFYENGNQLTNLLPLGRDGNGIVSFVWKHGRPGEQISVTVKYDNKRELEPLNFKTEDAIQIPNGGFEEWSIGPDGLEGHGDYESKGFLSSDYQYTHKPYRSWERWYPFISADLGHWDTLNEYTTSLGEESETFSKVGTGNKRWTRYVANSGTIRSEDHNSGNYSALVRTVGWGDGNTGGGDASVVNVITPGELYLGTYADGANYGISFKSRPIGVKFKYKYKAKNADKFIAEIVVKSENEIIAQAALDDSKKNKDTNWNEVVISIPNYINKKATSMYVRFVSGVSTSRNDIMLFAPLANLTTGENVGSQLYIDDVELIYDYQE